MYEKANPEVTKTMNTCGQVIQLSPFFCVIMEIFIIVSTLCYFNRATEVVYVCCVN